MIIPNLQVQSLPKTHSVYTACDSGYFADFAKAFANSIFDHSDFDVHFHIFNPDPGDLAYCANADRVTCSFEHIALEAFSPAAKFWDTVELNDEHTKNLARTQNAMVKGQDDVLIQRLQKTYFACIRFVRLRDIFDSRYNMFAMDVDAVVQKRLIAPGQDHDFYIHRIHGKKARFLAGAIWLNARESNKRFLHEYAESILHYFETDHIYWGIDQDMLEQVVPRFPHAELGKTYIDWDMLPHSMVWTAKGTRKSDPRFLAAQHSFKI